MHDASRISRGGSKTGGTRSKSSIGRELGRWRAARVLIAIRENLSVIQGPGGTGCEHGQPFGEKRSAFRKRSRGARGARERAPRGRDVRRAPGTCHAEWELRFRKNRRMHPARETALRMHRATREFERGHSLIRVVCPAIFLRARRKRNRVVETRWCTNALGIMNSRSRSVTSTLSASGSLLPPYWNGGSGSRVGKGERKLIVNATGTKLPNRLSPGRTGPLISRAGASTRRTLFLRGGPC